MPTPILTTKLYAPPHRQKLVLRPRLLAKLNEGLHRKLTLISAPAGFEMLEALERGNLFVVPLDDERRWYRYHHLFADVLLARSMEVQPDRAATLHLLASEWYEQNGRPCEAIAHALAAKNHERAAGLLELAWPAMEGSSLAATWVGWVRALPDELTRARPALSVWYAYALLGRAEMAAAESRLKDAERLLANPSTRMVVDERQFAFLLATIATGRAYLAQALGDVSGTMTYAQRALDLLPEADHLRREQATGLLGLACWARGDLEAGGVRHARCEAGAVTAPCIVKSSTLSSGYSVLPGEEWTG